MVYINTGNQMSIMSWEAGVGTRTLPSTREYSFVKRTVKFKPYLRDSEVKLLNNFKCRSKDTREAEVEVTGNTDVVPVLINYKVFIMAEEGEVQVQKGCPITVQNKGRHFLAKEKSDKLPSRRH